MILLLISLLLMLCLGVLSVLRFHQYLLISIVFVGLSLLPFFARFEHRKLSARKVVLLAVLVAVAAVSRVPFAAIPSVQPTTFVIIVTALVFGAESGFMVGALAALISNMFLGQGPWTPWQMLAWGMVGFAAGMLRDTWWMRRLWGRVIFGFVIGFLFGWIMNLMQVLSLLNFFSWDAFFALYAASVLFDLMHALTNVFFLGLFSRSWIKILTRFKKKYGLG